jgi:hypothetical protein
MAEESHCTEITRPRTIQLGTDSELNVLDAVQVTFGR